MKVTFTGERLKTFPQRSVTRQEGLLLPFPFNTVLEVPARPIKQEKETISIQIGKEEVKIIFIDRLYDLTCRKP